MGIHGNIPSGYLTVCHGIDGPFMDDFPTKTSIYGWDFPWLC